MKNLIDILGIKFNRKGLTKTAYGNKNINGVDDMIKIYLKENLFEVVVTNLLNKEVERFFTTDKGLIEAYKKNYDEYSNCVIEVNNIVLNYNKDYNEKGQV